MKIFATLKERFIDLPRRRREIDRQAREELMADRELRDTFRSLKGQAAALKVINPHSPELKRIQTQLKEHFKVLKSHGIKPKTFLKP